MTANQTRRDVLKAGAAIGASAIATSTFGTVTANPGRGDERGNGKSFGAVYADGTLWRTHVVRVLDERPDPEDRLYFLHDGTGPIVANPNVGPAQQSPFVSESAPGDRDWNGGKWVTYSAHVTDVDAFLDAVPVADAATILTADYVDVTLGNPGFGPPNYFVCPLNGRV